MGEEDVIVGKGKRGRGCVKNPCGEKLPAGDITKLN